MTKKCLFCNELFSKAKNSKEHIFRQKNRDLFGLNNSGTKIVQATGSQDKTNVSYKAFPSSSFEQTVRGICNVCNNGWMNGIDNEFERLQYRLVKNLPVFAGQSELYQIRLWAYKTALIRTILDKNAEGSIPHHHFHRLYNDRELNSDVCIWLFNSHNPIDTYSRHNWAQVNNTEYHQVTISIGAMAIYVYMSSAPIPIEIKKEIESSIQKITDNKALEIWPSGKSFVWPASMRPISHQDISNIATTIERAFESSNSAASLATHIYMEENF